MLICFVVILYTTNAVYPSPERYYINLTIRTQNRTSTTQQKIETCIRQTLGSHNTHEVRHVTMLRQKSIRTLSRMNRIHGVMVSVLATSAVDRGFEPQKTIKLVFVASPLNTQH